MKNRGKLEMPKGIIRAILFTWIVLSISTASAKNITVSDVADNVICQCGCSNMVLSTCQCGTADDMKNEISEMINNGMKEQAIYTRYIKQYGQTVMAAPPKEGFYNIAWFTPIIGILLFGLVIIISLKKWSSQNEYSSAQEEELLEDDIVRGKEYYENKLDEELENFMR